MSLFEVLSTLESATGNATKILANPFLDAMGRFILSAHIAGDDYVAYGDAHAQGGSPRAMCFTALARRFTTRSWRLLAPFYAEKRRWNAGSGLRGAMDVI